MSDLNEIAAELGEIGRVEAKLTRYLARTQLRRCQLHEELGKMLSEMGLVDKAIIETAMRKEPPAPATEGEAPDD